MGHFIGTYVPVFRIMDLRWETSGSLVRLAPGRAGVVCPYDASDLSEQLHSLTAVLRSQSIEVGGPRPEDVARYDAVITDPAGEFVFVGFRLKRDPELRGQSPAAPVGRSVSAVDIGEQLARIRMDLFVLTRTRFPNILYVSC